MSSVDPSKTQTSKRSDGHDLRKHHLGRNVPTAVASRSMVNAPPKVRPVMHVTRSNTHELCVDPTRVMETTFEECQHTTTAR